MPRELFWVQRHTSLRDRLRAVAGPVTSVTVLGPAATLRVSTPPGRPTRRPGLPVITVRAGEVTVQLGRRRDEPITEVLHRAPGTVLAAGQRMEPERWLAMLVWQLRELATMRVADPLAVARTLIALGVPAVAGDIVVDRDDPAAGLQLLPEQLRGLLPPDLVDVVTRICWRLADAATRVTGAEHVHVISRTAGDYLPETLRAYLALPPEWAATQRMPDGRTALQVLRDQLGVLEAAIDRVMASAATADAQALLINERFLQDKFGTRSDELGSG